MNIVIYARFSSHNQNEQSIEGQLKVCYEYAVKNNHTVIAEYIDRAASATTANRPDFLRMVNDSAQKQFQGVLVYQLDRFSRNRYDSAIFKHKLNKNGVSILSARENISDDPMGKFMEGIIEAAAEYYSGDLAQKIKRGMDMNAQKCLSTGGNLALGYKVDSEKRIHVDETTAPVVRKIFEMYAAGETIAEIVRYMNDQQIKTSRSGTFNKNSLRTLLRNKRYIGIYTYHSTETPGGIPRIVDDKVFAAVQKILGDNKKAPARGKAIEEFILTTKLFCGLDYSQ